MACEACGLIGAKPKAGIPNSRRKREAVAAGNTSKKDETQGLAVGFKEQFR